MTSRCARAAVRLACLLSFLTLPTGLLLAQNENETTGFQSNHVFESGAFGENIDILNGGLTLSIPIGPKYQINDRLGYGLVLTYNSKVWDNSEYRANSETSIRPFHDGPLGIGFTLNLGRLLQDIQNRPCHNNVDCWMKTWQWITKDGNGHVVWAKEDYGATPTLTPTGVDYGFGASAIVRTGDASYIGLHVPGSDCRTTHLPTGETPEDPNCFTLKTPDGLTYTLGHKIDYPNTIGNTYRGDNQSFGGWYVTRIEDRSVGSRDDSGLYSMNVRVEYDTRPGFDHAIRKIMDGAGREIVFHNCKYDTTGTCVDTPSTAADIYPGTENAPIYIRRPVATYQIDVPAFWGNEAVPVTAEDKAATKAIYQFKYTYAPVRRTHYLFQESTNTDGPVLELMRIDYPTYIHRDGGTPETYSMYFGYTGKYGLDPNRGELGCRSLPVTRDTTKTCYTYPAIPTVLYEHGYYPYSALFFSAHKTEGVTKSNSVAVGSLSISSATRQIVTKRIKGLDSNEYIWNYDRQVGSGFTNPQVVTVTESVKSSGGSVTFGNDTVYYYHATTEASNSADLEHNGSKPDDGLAPDWDDGLNYRVEYFRGRKGSGVLVRSETMEYEADATTLASGSTEYKKENSREVRKVTVFNDDAGSEVVVARSDWDGYGHYRRVVESGFDVPGTRTIYSNYLPTLPGGAGGLYMTGLSDYTEVNDGTRVLRRTEQLYTGGRILSKVERKTLPVVIGKSADLSTLGGGDVKTAFQYDAATGTILSKTLSRWNAQTTSLVDEYCIDYTWSLGAYLRSKTFKNCATGTVLPWKAIDRLRDGNTGIIFSTRDTAGLETRYGYDALGRLTDITPPAGEFPTSIDYATLTETTVKRGDVANYEFARYQYDGLGRLIREEKRPADPTSGNPYRTTCYDIQNRATFTSEWMRPGEFTGTNPCDPTAFPGTTYDYGSPADPFGRVQVVTATDLSTVPPQSQVTTTTYRGLDTTVTMNNVWGVGIAGGMGNISTTYRRDGWGRLWMVDAPLEKRCYNWGTICTSDTDCGGESLSCRATDGADAYYTYDQLGNLTEVRLVDQSAPKVQTRFFEYDALGHLYTSYNPESGTTVYQDYDSLGNVLAATDASGTTLRSVYDAAGRGLRIERAGAPNVVLAESVYDSGGGSYGGGKLTLAKTYKDDGSFVAQKSYTYSGLGGRLSSLAYGFQDWGALGQTVFFSHDAFGNVSTVTYPTGGSGGSAALTVSYDSSNGVPVAARDANTVLATVTYTAAGAVKSLTTLGGGRTEVAFDSRSRAKDVTIGKWSGTAFVGAPYYESQQYSYDGAGNIYRMAPPGQSALKRYRYDTANRLTEAVDTEDGVNYMQCYAYDAFGNMIGKVDRSGVSSSETCSGVLAHSWDYTFMMTAPNGTNTNRIVSEQIGSTLPIANFLYDARGNLTKDWERRYIYDSRNRLASIFRISNSSDPASAATELARYEYDSEGGRIVERDLARDLVTFDLRNSDGKVLSEFRRSTLGSYVPEWVKHHVYLAGREVGFKDNRVPSPPGRLNAATSKHGSTSDVKLQWRRNPAEQNITSYGIYRATWGGPLNYVGTTTGNCTADTADSVCYTESVTSDTTFSYQVVAVAGSYTSFGSDILDLTAGDTAAPPPPTCLRLTAGDGQVTVQWTGPTEIPQGYNVYRSTSSTGQKPRITQTPVDGTTYIDAGLTNGTTYYYSVRAVDAVGNESTDVANTGCSLFQASAQPKDYAAPGPPMNLVVTGDCLTAGSATLTWDPNPDTDQVSCYLVYRQGSNGTLEGPWPSATSGSNCVVATSFNDTGVTAGGIYYYWIVARDAANNYSLPSQHVGVAQRTTALPVPPGKIVATAGDGQVKLRIPAPTNSTQVGTLVIYRKPNASNSCGDYQQVGQVSSIGYQKCTNSLIDCTSDANCGAEHCKAHYWLDVTSIDYFDGNVPNNLAWDYAVASRSGILDESAMSQPALAIPVAAPRDFRECVEEVPTGTPECVTGFCPGNTSICRNHVIRWAPPADTDYHPLSATNADGALGYLLGYHEKRYTRLQYGTGSEGSVDESTFTEQSLDYESVSLRGCAQGPYKYCNGQTQPCGNWDTCVPIGTCTLDAAPSCTSAPCPNGMSCSKICSNNGNNCTTTPCTGNGVCIGTCWLPETNCVHATDCPAGASCVRDVTVPEDPYLLQAPGARLIYPVGMNPPLAQGGDCVTIESVYKIYANGDWQTVVSQPSSNFDLTKLSADSSSTGNRCMPQAFDVCSSSAPLCQPTPEPPDITAVPSVSTVLDGSNNSIPGKLRVSWNAPSNPIDLAKVAGYYVYVRESSSGGSQLRAPYGFRRPQPFTQVGPGQPWYEFSNLPRDGRAVAPFSDPSIAYQFQVAAFDGQGRVGKVSPLSASFTFPQVTALTPPQGLKAIIWTVNDASVEGDTSLATQFSYPRSYDGIKLQWKSGTWAGIRGFRVYRSESELTGYCALVQAGGTVLDAPVCPDPESKNTPYDTTLTRSTSEAGNNDRFFHDKSAIPNRTYYYKVKAIGDSVSASSASVFSAVVSGMILEHSTLPLSPPRHLKAWAPRKLVQSTCGGSPCTVPAGDEGIYLRWCPNRKQEQGTGYKVYRSQLSGGPYQQIATLTNPANVGDDCLLGSKRCSINCSTPPCLGAPTADATACTVGLGGSCKLVDKGIQYPSYTSTPSSQLAVVYYYVVTAVRGTEESAYSAENAAWPNYLVSGSSPPVYSPRYDQDNLGDFGCDDETSSIEVPVDDGVAIADVSLDQEAEQEFEARMSSYVVIGNRRSGGGGGGGGGGSAPPPVARWLFLHSDHLGSPRVVMDDAGNKVSGHHYMPFGEEKPLGTRLTSNAAKFTGHERDVESASFDNPDGLDYMSARYYSSSLGRFMAVDPGDDTDPQNPQSWNKYAYVRNSPLNAIDRKGTDTFFLPANQQQLNQAIATAPAAAARVQRDRDIAAGRKESMQRMENALGGTSKIATGVAVLAGVASLIPGPHQALSIPLAIKAEIIATCADVGKLTIDRSNENVITVGIDVVGGGTLKSVGGFLAREGKAFSEPVGHVVGGAMLGAATLLAPKLDEAIGGPSTGGDDTSVDRAIADKEARAAKGPAPKEKKK